MLTIEWTPDGATESQVINFDASVREGFEATAEATEHAVETGQAVTDYVRPNAPTVSLECVVTNTPVVSALSQMDGAVETQDGAALTVGGAPVRALVTQYTGVFDRVGAIDALLQGFVHRGQRVKVYTSLRVLTNMVVTRAAVARDADTANALDLTLELRRIRIASTQRVAAPRRVRRAVNRGAQPATDVRPLDSIAVSSGLGTFFGIGPGG